MKSSCKNRIKHGKTDRHQTSGCLQLIYTSTRIRTKNRHTYKKKKENSLKITQYRGIKPDRNNQQRDDHVFEDTKKDRPFCVQL